MKPTNYQYALYGLFSLSLIFIFFPWSTTTIFYPNSSMIAGFDIPKLTESGISTSIGIVALFVCLIGIGLTFNENKYTAIAGIANVFISIIHMGNISKVNGRIEELLGASAKVGYGVILFLLLNIAVAILAFHFYGNKRDEQ